MRKGGGKGGKCVRDKPQRIGKMSRKIRREVKGRAPQKDVEGGGEGGSVGPTQNVPIAPHAPHPHIATQFTQPHCRCSHAPPLFFSRGTARLPHTRTPGLLSVDKHAPPYRTTPRDALWGAVRGSGQQLHTVAERDKVEERQHESDAAEKSHSQRTSSKWEERKRETGIKGRNRGSCRFRRQE